MKEKLKIDEYCMNTLELNFFKLVITLANRSNVRERDNNLYKSCILLGIFNSPPNLVRDKGIYSTRAGSILTSAGPAWDLRVQLMEHEGEDQ
jgi:hypothetical protein